MKLTNNKTITNISANLLGRIWVVLANLLIVPFYIKYLGHEQYGLVTFFVTLQTVINLIGLGLSKTLRREFSQQQNDIVNKRYKYRMFRSTEFVYIFLILFAVGVSFLFSNTIANKWLKLETLDIQYVSNVIKMMSASIGILLLSNLYLGCFYGMQKQVFANSIQATSISIKYIFAIFLLQFSTNLIYIYGLYMFVDLFFILFLRFVLIKNIDLDL